MRDYYLSLEELADELGLEGKVLSIANSEENDPEFCDGVCITTDAEPEPAMTREEVIEEQRMGIA